MLIGSSPLRHLRLRMLLSIIRTMAAQHQRPTFEGACRAVARASYRSGQVSTLLLPRHTAQTAQFDYVAFVRLAGSSYSTVDMNERLIGTHACNAQVDLCVVYMTAALR